MPLRDPESPRVLVEEGAGDSPHTFSPEFFDCSGLNWQLGTGPAVRQMCVGDSSYLRHCKFTYRLWMALDILDNVSHWELEQHMLYSLCLTGVWGHATINHVRVTWLIWLMVDAPPWGGSAVGPRVWVESQACGSRCLLWIPWVTHGIQVGGTAKACFWRERENLCSPFILAMKS